jgi:hypothetical protein
MCWFVSFALLTLNKGVGLNPFLALRAHLMPIRPFLSTNGR